MLTPEGVSRVRRRRFTDVDFRDYGLNFVGNQCNVRSKPVWPIFRRKSTDAIWGYASIICSFSSELVRINCACYELMKFLLTPKQTATLSTAKAQLESCRDITILDSKSERLVLVDARCELRDIQSKLPNWSVREHKVYEAAPAERTFRKNRY